jgi:MFS family permease
MAAFQEHAATPAAGPVRYRAGTLSYTRFGLATLFFWLLWGHFVYVLMEAVIPAILPLLLRHHKATNTEISFITTSLNVIGNMAFNPVVSFWSDRHRGPSGRRRPFIVWTTPFVVLCLALTPFGPDLAAWLGTFPEVRRVLDLSPVVPAVLFAAVFVAGFQVFDVFVGSVYYYLVRDTVPEDHLGRFYGWFRLAGSLAPLLFNLLIFGHAETHMKTVFVAVAVFYGVGMYLMCWNVKEGEYPPPEDIHHGHAAWYARLWDCLRAYVRDCLRDPVYGWTFLATGVAMWAGSAGVFAVLFYREELCITLKVQGQVNAINNVLTLCIALPLGWLVDRWNYFRLTQLGAAVQGLVCIGGWLLIRDVPTLIAFGVLYTVPKMAYVMAMTRSIIAVYPKEKYGQFGSAGAAFASLGSIAMSIVAAKFVDALGNYRSYLLWQGIFLVVAGLLFVVVERRWLKLGGAKGYRAP